MISIYESFIIEHLKYNEVCFCQNNHERTLCNFNIKSIFNTKSLLIRAI